LAGCCECGDEPSGSGATELVSYIEVTIFCNCVTKQEDSVEYLPLLVLIIVCVHQETKICELIYVACFSLTTQQQLTESATSVMSTPAMCSPQGEKEQQQHRAERGRSR
jgi:hypothetical protein